MHTCVQIPVIHVSCARICQHISFHPPFGGFLWHVLNEAQSAFEANHRFVDGHLLRQNVVPLEVGEQALDEWPEFV